MNDAVITTSTWAARFDRAIEALVVLLLAFMPLAFGATDPWSEQVVLTLVLAMAAALAIKLLACPGVAFVWSWSYLPIALFLLLVLAQLAPLPAAVVRVISPATVSTKAWLLGDGVAPATISTTTLSFYPHATIEQLRLLFAISLFYVVVLNTFKTSRQIQRLLAVVGVVGTGVAMLSLLQVISGSHKIYWLFPQRHPDSGTFANHSHLGQFLNLSIGALLALLLVRLRERQDRRSEKGLGLRQQMFGRSSGAFWTIGTAIAVCFAAICCSLTRGGILSATIAGGITAAVAAHHFGTRPRDLIAGAGVGLILALVLFGGFDSLFERLATLRNVPENDLRPAMAADIWALVRKYPLFGTGLGTHEFVYPMVQTILVRGVARHADNEYAQLAEEVGAFGLIVIVLFTAIIAVNYVRNLGRRRRPIRMAVVGLGFGLLAILIHSASDFGQHVPAIACLSAISMAVVVSIFRLDRITPDTAAAAHTWRSLSARGAGVALVVIAGSLSWAMADNARRADARWRVATALDESLRARDWQGSNEEYARLIAAASAASELQPGNAWFAHWTSVYRWKAAARLRDEQDKLRVFPETMAVAAAVATQLETIRPLCPPLALNNAFAGQLYANVLGQAVRGRALLDLAVAQAPSTPSVLYSAGSADARSERWDVATARLQRCQRADPSYQKPIIQLLAIELQQPEKALAVDLESPSYVLRLLQTLRSDESQAAIVARSSAYKSLIGRADVSPYVLATLADWSEREGRADDALEYYRRALQKRTGELAWRIGSARCLGKLGEVEAAIQEVRACLLIQPGRRDATQLLQALKTQLLRAANSAS